MREASIPHRRFRYSDRVFNLLDLASASQAFEASIRLDPDQEDAPALGRGRLGVFKEVDRKSALYP
jgi:hypothetical protein